MQPIGYDEGKVIAQAMKILESRAGKCDHLQWRSYEPDVQPTSPPSFSVTVNYESVTSIVVHLPFSKLKAGADVLADYIEGELGKRWGTNTNVEDGTGGVQSGKSTSSKQIKKKAEAILDRVKPPQTPS